MKTSFLAVELALLVMVGLRILSGFIELTAAGLMFKLNSIEKAISINALLATVGPAIFIISIMTGLIGMSDRLSLSKFIYIGVGVVLILIGIRK